MTTATSPTPELEHLARLVGREELAHFLQHRFGRDAWRRRLPEGAARELFDWTRLNAALAEHRLSPPRLRLERAGGDATKGVFTERRTRRGRVLHDLDAAALTARLRDGATLILDAANEVSPPLQALCAGLAAELSATCQANLYACWGTTQGFDVHWDDHDVFVVQVEGRKRWRLYGSTRTAPTQRDRHAEHRRPADPLEETVLEPGEVLYLPRGYWHAAVGQGEPTLHLTVGITRKTGSDFLHWVANQALSHDLGRMDLPLEGDDAALGARLTELLQNTLAEASPAELGRRYRRHVQASTPQRPRLSFPHIGEQDAAYAPEARIALSDGARALRVAEGGSVVVLSHRGARYTVSAELEGPLTALAEGRPVPYGDFELAAGGEERAADFVSDMIRRGVFVVAS